MHVTLFTEERFITDADGAIHTLGGAPASAQWMRYLDAFEHVTVVARIDATAGVPRDSGDDRISFLQVPYYVGPTQYLHDLPAIRRAIRTACDSDSAFILRVPGRLGVLAASALRRAGRPYAVEIVGDPADIYARGAVTLPLRPMLRQMFTAEMRRLAREAAVASYVTECTLQRRYPCPSFQLGVSDVLIDDAALVSEVPRQHEGQRTFRIVLVGSLAQLYKGPDVLLDALARCVARGLDVHAVLVGDGRFRSVLQDRAAALGLQTRVTFRGELPSGAAVRAELDAADLFVLPSRAEGLPRALIEAMARGLPCIASRVGGIPELLPPEDLVPVGDSAALATRIEDVLTDTPRRERMAARNLARARDFRAPLLIPRRAYFWAEVRRRALAERVAWA